MTRNMNIRQGPGTNYAVIGGAETGQQFTITGKNETGDWWQINFNGNVAWVYAPFVDAKNHGGVKTALDIPRPPDPVSPTTSEQQPSQTTKPEPVLGIVIQPEHRCSPYNSDDYGYSQGVEQVIVNNMGGRIYSPYTGQYFANTGETDIEHIVARSEAHDSGL